MENELQGKLYIVPTPIGNLQDLTFRALEVLQEVDLIGAEDTRKSSILLNHYKIETPSFSYHKFNERSRVDMILEKLREGRNVAIISEAGTPGISDPAKIIIDAAIQADMEVVTLPGPTAFLPALISSGLNTERFYFAGFLPEKKALKEEFLKNISDIGDTLIFYEAPHRLVKFMQVLNKFLGDRSVVFAREISKLFETYSRTTIADFLSEPSQVNIKGEFVILVEGKKQILPDKQELIELLQQRMKQELPLKKLAKIVSTETGLNRNLVYETALQLRKGKSID